jgi:hypothetical protein
MIITPPLEWFQVLWEHHNTTSNQKRARFQSSGKDHYTGEVVQRKQHRIQTEYDRGDR